MIFKHAHLLINAITVFSKVHNKTKQINIMLTNKLCSVLLIRVSGVRIPEGVPRRNKFCLFRFFIA